MSNIVVTIHPFVREQEVNVYIEEKCVKTVQSTLEDLEETVFKLCKKYDINNVITFGGQLYALKMKEHFATSKFSKYNINIEVR
jgi:hypothetical protein